MLWNLLVLISALLSVIYGNSLIENGLEESPVRPSNGKDLLSDASDGPLHQLNFFKDVGLDDSNSPNYPLSELEELYGNQLYDSYECSQSDSAKVAKHDKNALASTLEGNKKKINSAVNPYRAYNGKEMPPLPLLLPFARYAGRISREPTNKIDKTADYGALFDVLHAKGNELYDDLLVDVNKEEMKRSGGAAVIGCDCKIKNDLIDLGQEHFPRYLLNAVCQSQQTTNDFPEKCRRGSHCKPLEYKVKVLTFRTLLQQGQKEPALAWLSDDSWKFKTVTVAAGCFCAY